MPTDLQAKQLLSFQSLEPLVSWARRRPRNPPLPAAPTTQRAPYAMWLTGQQPGPLPKFVTPETVTGFSRKLRGPLSPSILCFPAMFGPVRLVPPCAPISSPSFKLDLTGWGTRHTFSRTGFLACGYWDRNGAAGGLLLLGCPELHLFSILPPLLRLQPGASGALHGRDLPPAAGSALLWGPFLPLTGGVPTLSPPQDRLRSLAPALVSLHPQF